MLRLPVPQDTLRHVDVPRRVFGKVELMLPEVAKCLASKLDMTVASSSQGGVPIQLEPFRPRDPGLQMVIVE